MCSESGNPQAVTLTVRHRPTNEDEKNRIEKIGGAVFSGRVFGALAVSRYFGIYFRFP